MARTHDLRRQIGYIQQTLAQNKKAIGILIAAGCPLSIRVNEQIVGEEKITDPLIPDIAGLTKIITDKLTSKETTSPTNCDKLVSQLKEYGIKTPNIEDILTEVRSLIQVARNGNVRGFVESDLLELDKEICKIISSEVDKELPKRDSPYHDVAIWARSTEREKPVHIFTTNYDLLVEQAFEEEACPYFDGFIGSKKAFFDLGAVENEYLLPPRWTRLWKIHGSINWRLDSQKNVIRSSETKNNESYLIYPSHLKYDQSRKMPYLAMLDRLKDFLMSGSAALFLCGYSFSDEHINNVIVQTLRNNPTGIAFGFLFGELEDPKYQKAIECAKQVSNLSLFAFDKAVIGRSIGKLVLKDEGTIVDIPAEIVRLTSKKGVDKKGKPIEPKSAEFLLGDFAKFGQFLREISSNQKEENEAE
jgi:hypothetical protein